jgi:hypothetical protein
MSQWSQHIRDAHGDSFVQKVALAFASVTEEKLAAQNPEAPH